MRKSNTNDSFIKARNELLRRMTKASKGPIVARIIRFTNNDVPRFLRRYNRFERASRQSAPFIAK